MKMTPKPDHEAAAFPADADNTENAPPPARKSRTVAEIASERVKRDKPQTTAPKDLRELGAVKGAAAIRALAASGEELPPPAAPPPAARCWRTGTRQDGSPVIDWQKYFRAAQIGTDETQGMTAEEIRETLPPPVIHGIARQGSVMLMAGASKARKSWLALHLALAVRTGGSFVGFRTEQAHVRYIDFELKSTTGRARYSLARLGLTEGAEDMQAVIDDGFSWHSLRSHPSEQGILPGIGAWLRSDAKPGELWIVDCLQPALEVDQNDALAVRRELGPLLAAAADTGALLCLIDHYNKSSESRGMARVSGSVAKVAAADTIVTMTPRDDGIIELDFDLREDPPIDGRVLVRFNNRTHGFDTVTAEEMESAGERARAAKLTEWMQAAWPGGVNTTRTRAELAAAWGMDSRGNGTRNRIGALAAAGLIESAGKKGKAEAWQCASEHLASCGTLGTLPEIF